MHWLFHLILTLLALQIRHAISKGSITLPVWAVGAISSYLDHTQDLLSMWLAYRYFIPIQRYCMSFAYLVLKVLPVGVRNLRAAVSRRIEVFQWIISTHGSEEHVKGPPESHQDTAPTLESTYHYQPIRGSDEIRLLELLPPVDGGYTDPLTCRLTHVRLSEVEPYEALSYCWHDSGEPGKVSSQGGDPVLHVLGAGSLVITPNLRDALRVLRHTDPPGPLWVDQICINQSDDNEKSSQVALMKDIYSRASQVLVWLGNDSTARDSAEAMRLAEAIAMSAKNKGLLLEEKGIMDLDPEKCARYEIPNFTEANDQYMALAKLLGRPWFTRAWVVQEVTFTKATLICGTSSTNFASIIIAGHILMEKAPLLMAAAGATNRHKLALNAIAIAVSERLSSRNRSTALTDVLAQHRACHATQPQDKVFAFLGIARDADDIGVKPDYTKDPRSVFIDTAAAMLSYYTNLDLLSVPKPLIAGEDDEKPMLDLPSWVPDWTAQPGKPSLRTRGISGFYPGNFSASGTSEREIKFRNGKTTLGVRGYIVDRVEEVGDTCEVLNELGGGDTVYATITQWEKIASVGNREKYAPTGEDMWTAYGDTVTCGGASVVAELDRELHDSLPPLPYPQAMGTISPDHEAPYDRQYRFYRSLQRVGTRIGALTWIPKRMFSLIATVLTILDILLLIMPELLQARDKDGTGEPAEWVSRSFKERLQWSISGGALMRTKGGYIGMVGPGMRPGDCVALLAGGRVPYILREREPRGPDGGDNVGEEKEWELLQDAYVHGMMMGEVFDESRCETLWIV